MTKAIIPSLFEDTLFYSPNADALTPQPPPLRFAVSARTQRTDYKETSRKHIGAWFLVTAVRLGIFRVYVESDSGRFSDAPIEYADGRIVYDFPERIPDYVKKAVQEEFAAQRKHDQKKRRDAIQTAEKLARRNGCHMLTLLTKEDAYEHYHYWPAFSPVEELQGEPIATSFYRP